MLKNTLIAAALLAGFAFAQAPAASAAGLGLAGKENSLNQKNLGWRQHRYGHFTERRCDRLRRDCLKRWAVAGNIGAA